MRIQYLSDLHLEWSPLVIDPSDQPADVVVIAGDVFPGGTGIDWMAATWPQSQIIFVPGNHEFYRGIYQDRKLELLMCASKYQNVHLLDGKDILIDGVQFIGATLWTDLKLFENGKSNKPNPGCKIRDFMGAIQFRDCRQDESFDLFAGSFATRPFREDDATAIFKQERAFLKRALKKPGTEERPIRKRVVVTHHLPSARSIAPQFIGDALSPYFASNLDALVSQSDYWIHGHSHCAVQYFINQAEVLCNPRGYVKEGIEPENPTFNPSMFIDI